MNTAPRPLAIVTGASSGIGLEFARLCVQKHFDVIIAADEPAIESAARDLGSDGARVQAVQCDLSTLDGVDTLYRAALETGHPVNVLIANAGTGLGHGFLDQDLDEALKVVHTNVDGTLALVHRVGRQMREQGSGRILITGSIAGFMPGTFNAVYNGSKAFLDSFAVALSNELKDSGVSVTCLMPGATDTRFFERADMLDTKLGADQHKADPADVARTGFDAMLKGEVSVVHGISNKLRAAAAHVVPDEALAEMHRKMAEPGSAPNP